MTIQWQPLGYDEVETANVWEPIGEAIPAGEIHALWRAFVMNRDGSTAIVSICATAPDEDPTDSSFLILDGASLATNKADTSFSLTDSPFAFGPGWKFWVKADQTSVFVHLTGEILPLKE